MQRNRWMLLATGVGSSILTTLVLDFGLGASPITAQPIPIDQQVSTLMAEHQATRQALQRTQIMAVTYQLDASGFHGLDEQLADGNMVPGALGRVRRARIATEATDWPQAMEGTIRDMVQQMRALEDALRDEDVERAAPHAHELHEIAHDLSEESYAWLGGGSR